MNQVTLMYGDPYSYVNEEDLKKFILDLLAENGLFLKDGKVYVDELYCKCTTGVVEA